MSFWQNLRRFLAEDSIGEQETRKLIGFLQSGLAASETDADFERVMRQLLLRSTGLRTEREWLFLLKRLYPYRRFGEETGHLRAVAQRYLADLERMYPSPVRDISPDDGSIC